MTQRRNQSIPLATAIMALAFGAAAQAQEQKPPDPSDIADGMRLFQQKGNCQACHGWAGDGHKTDSQMPDGAQLARDQAQPRRSGHDDQVRAAQLPDAGLRQVRLQRRAMLRQEAGRLKAYPTRMPDPPATLQQREIELIADFLIAKVVGKGPMNHAKCVEFWGSETDACKEFPNRVGEN